MTWRNFIGYNRFSQLTWTALYWLTDFSHVSRKRVQWFEGKGRDLVSCATFVWQMAILRLASWVQWLVITIRIIPNFHVFNFCIFFFFLYYPTIPHQWLQHTLSIKIYVTKRLKKIDIFPLFFPFKKVSLFFF